VCGVCVRACVRACVCVNLHAGLQVSNALHGALVRRYADDDGRLSCVSFVALVSRLHALSGESSASV